MLYSRSTNGFYSKEIHGATVPHDAIEVKDDVYKSLLEGQSSGLRIVPGPDGLPTLSDPLPPPPPTSVTMRQARLALLLAGKLDDVDASLSRIENDVDRRSAQIEWEFAQTVDRGSPWVSNLATELGLSASDLDTLFITASTL